MKDKHLTTNQGAPVADDQNSLTVGQRGPVVLQDVHLIEKLAHFDSERIPERVVHAKGAGAHGYSPVPMSLPGGNCRGDVDAFLGVSVAWRRSFRRAFARDGFAHAG